MCVNVSWITLDLGPSMSRPSQALMVASVYLFPVDRMKGGSRSRSRSSQSLSRLGCMTEICLECVQIGDLMRVVLVAVAIRGL